jgi:hypothetical protein
VKPEALGAVSTTFGSETRGLSRLEDGTLVRDAIAAEPGAAVHVGFSRPVELGEALRSRPPDPAAGAGEW